MDHPTDIAVSPPHHEARRGSGTVASPHALRKRNIAQSTGMGLDSPGSDDAQSLNRRKSHKVSRACDHCKQRKAKCSGTLPCAKCSRKGLVCLYDARYSRGRPPTPPPSRDHPDNARTAVTPVSTATQIEPTLTLPVQSQPRPTNGRIGENSGLASRASPELGMAEIEGQVFDPTSGVTFLHRAWKRLAKHDNNTLPSDEAYSYASIDKQPVMLAGDRPLPPTTEEDVHKLSLPGHQELVSLMALYFDVCIATYRIVHRPSVEAWFQAVEENVRHGKLVWQDIGKARASIVLACLAVATAHYEKSKNPTSIEDEALSLARSDHLFCVSAQLTEAETGSPRLESAQVRIIQTLYLLTTSRMNRAWYTFGNALQLISALGMHRKAAKKRHLATSSVDYLQAQLRSRTFWTAYVLDKYLGVIFGRPRHFHDDDIDQDLPDRLEDEEMTSQGPITVSGEQMGCHIDALIFHTKIARIIGKVSREVYSIKPISEDERISAAHRLSKEIHEWKSSLPPYLGSIRPSMLITSFRRQSIVLRLAYSHAIMHANRLFLLAPLYPESETQIAECVNAARTVFETVDGLAAEGPIFHAFWWTQYVTFCALVVSYVWDIQLKRRGTILVGDEQVKHANLMELAQRCQTHLAKATATNSPSRRYAVILEEFRSEIMGQKVTQDRDQMTMAEPHGLQGFGGDNAGQMMDASYGAFDHQPVMMPTEDVGHPIGGYSLLDEWHTTDWLDLDSSAFGPYMMDLDTASLQWIPNMEI